MRFEKIKFRGIEPFKGEQEVDLTALNGPVIALVGENGEGKSTFCELLPGALHRKTPTRGTLAQMSRVRDSFVEVTVWNGRRYTVRQQIDGLSGKGEALITDEAGAPLTSGKVKDADAWIGSHFPSPEVLYTSSFAVQKSEGFLELARSARLRVLAEAMGVERYEPMGREARDEAGRLKAEIETLRARFADVEREIQSLLVRAGADADTSAETDIGERCRLALNVRSAADQRAVDDSGERVRTARVALDRAKTAAADASRRAELIEQRSAAVKRLTDAEAKLADLNERIVNNRKLLERKDEIRGAQVRAGELDAAIEAAREVQRKAEQAANTASGEFRAARAEVDRVAVAIYDADEAIKRLVGRLKDRAEVEAADERLVQLAGRQAEVGAQLAAAEAKSVAALAALRAAEQGTSAADASLRAACADVDRIAKAIGTADEDLARLVDRLIVLDRIVVIAEHELRRMAERQAEVEPQLKEAETRAEEAESLLLTSKDKRIGGMHAGLYRIGRPALTCEQIDDFEEGVDLAGVENPAAFAAAVLRDDEELAARADSAPRDLAAAKAEVTRCRDRLKQIAEHVRVSQAKAARRGEMEQAQADKDRADAQRAALSEQLNAATAARAAAELAASEAQARSQAAGRDIDLLGNETTDCRQVLQEITATVSKTQALAARRGEMEQAQADKDRADAQRAALSEQLNAATAARAAAELAASEAQAFFEVTGSSVTGIRSERDALAPLLGQVALLDQAEARIEAYEAQLAPNEATAALAHRELASLPELDTAAPIDLSTFERDLALAEQYERATRERLTHNNADIERAKGAIERRAELAADIGRIETEIADWTRVSQDMADLKAMEIDASLPRVNELANQLLHSTFGTRYTVELRTDKLSADGSRVLEDLDVRVIDLERGYDNVAERYSGGQKVIISEALSLAITAEACQRNGIERPTLIRDESGAALNDKNARAYLAMLRKAVVLINADRVLLVTHSKEIQEMADARLVFANGTITVAA